MLSDRVQPTGHERFFPENEIIVSKTDLKGRISYVNQTFMDVADYSEDELLGKPHSIIRHPDMPRCVFKLLWDTLEARQEIFAFVKNMAKTGDHYWVLAHVTPTFDGSRNPIGYHSNRRVPERKQVELFDGIYRELLAEEKRFSDRRAGMDSAGKLLGKMLAARKVEYEEFIFTV
jgi:PAS domain S-box-containing protein